MGFMGIGLEIVRASDGVCWCWGFGAEDAEVQRVWFETAPALVVVAEGAALGIECARKRVRKLLRNGLWVGMVGYVGMRD